MIVAVAVVRVVQVTVDEVVDVIAVWHRLVTTICTMHVIGGVRAAGVGRSARGGVGGVDRDGALIDVAVVLVMQMSVMQIVDMIAVLDGGVTAGRTVDVIVLGMGVVAHGLLFRLGVAGGVETCSPACSNAARISSRT